MKYFTVVLFSCFVFGLFADNIDYSVADWGTAEVRKAGDGTIFLNYNYAFEDRVFAGEAYGFTLYLWVEKGGAVAEFPTPAVPVQVRKLSGQDVSHWFTITPSSAVFTGYGTDPDTLGQPPHGLFVATRVSFVVKPESLTERITQVKIQANTAGIPNLGNGHGIIVRLIRDGQTPRFDVTSWVSDSNFVPIDTFLVTKRRCDCCRCRRMGRCCCGCERSLIHPASFWYNVFVTNYETTLPDLVTRINPLHRDFVAVPFDNNANYVWLVPVNVTNPDFGQAIPNGFNLSYGPTPIAPQGTEFMAYHFKYDLGVAPVESLPRTYDFSATATASGVTLYTDDLLVGKLVTRNCCGHCGCGGGGGCEQEEGAVFSARLVSGGLTTREAGSIRLSLPDERPVVMALYSVDGREVQTLVKARLGQGTHNVRISNRLAAGVYFCKIQAGADRASLKVVVTK